MAISGHLITAARRFFLLISAVTTVLVQVMVVLAPATTSRRITAAYQLSATALFMGGTGQPLVIPPNTPYFIRAYVNDKYSDYVAPSGLCTGGDPGCTLVAVYTPEQLGPLIGALTFDKSVAVGRDLLDGCIRGAACTATVSPYETTGSTTFTDAVYVVFGQSQSAVISSYEKSDLIARPPVGATVSFVLLSNENRPNGGILERFVGVYIPILGITFNGATPTNSPEATPLTTVDIAAQYDGWADFPTNPLNLLADLNAVLGAVYLHGDVKAYSGAPQLQGYFQDTAYYLLPDELLPLVIPLSRIPVFGPPLAEALDPPLRVLVEAGYDRTINPGQPTPAKYLYFPNPIKMLVDVVVAIPTGWDDAIASITGNPANRPFHTAPQPVYGVGGPPVYAGAVDPYGSVDPSVTAQVVAVKPPTTDPDTSRIAERDLVARASSSRAHLGRGSKERTPVHAANTRARSVRAGYIRQH